MIFGKGGDTMKARKRTIIILLVLVMAVVSFIPATFSWYDHNDSLTGYKLRYEKSNLPVSAGSISVSTKEYKMDPNNPDKVFYDEKGNKQYQGSALTAGSVSAGATQYYGTTFTNSGSAPAYVNLYLNGFTHNPKNLIGTTAPNLTERGVSSTVHLTNKNMVRVYCQFENANDWNHESANRYVVYKTKTGSSNCIEITNEIDNNNDSNNILSGKETYYVDLPDDTMEFYFATDGHKGGFSTDTLTVTQPWYRTRTITSVKPETGYYLTGFSDDTTWNAQYVTFSIPGGISVMTYFDTAVMSSGQHTYVTLNNGVNYTGASAVYTVPQNSLVSVNGNTGYVTAGNSFGVESTATITTTITGSLGDSTTVTTAVSNPSTVNAPVSLNVEIPAGTFENGVLQKAGTAEVVWYIKNNSSATCNFASVYYTK